MATTAIALQQGSTDMGDSFAGGKHASLHVSVGRHVSGLQGRTDALKAVGTSQDMHAHNMHMLA